MAGRGAIGDKWASWTKYNGLMESKPTAPPMSPPSPDDTPLESERNQISQNIGAVQDFYLREDQKISHSQRILERISLVLGRPIYLGFILLFVVVWKQSMNPDLVLAALDEGGGSEGRLHPVGYASGDAEGDQASLVLNEESLQNDQLDPLPKLPIIVKH